MKHHNQTQRILAWLMKGKALTQVQAIDLFKCYRLSARILEIREEYGDKAVSTTRKRGGLAVYKWEGAN